MVFPIKRIVVSLSAALALALPAAAQLVESIEVRVTNLDVIATDSAGRPVLGLTREDFELFEDGKPQPITNFYEVRASSGAAVEEEEAAAEESVVDGERRQRRIIVFVDNTTLAPHRRNEVFTAVSKSLDTLLRPGDEVMVMAWERRLKLLQTFTADAAEVRRVLRGAAKASAGASSLAAEREGVIQRAYDLLAVARSSRRASPTMVQDAYREAVSSARAYQESQYGSMRALLTGVRQMVSTLSGLEGRKALLFVGGELQQKPGLDVMETVNSIFRGAGVNVGNAVMMDGARNLREDLERVIEAAAGGGVSMYMVDTGERSSPGDATSERPADSLAGFLADSETLMTMGQLAESTGGRALSGTKNYRVVLDGMAGDLGSYYSLGYRANVGKGVRRVHVRSRRDGVSVRSRKVVHHKSAHEEMEDRVISNAFYSRREGDFAVSIKAAPPQRDGRNYRVAITVSFSSDLVYVPDGDSMAGEFGVYIVVAGIDGSLSPVASDVRSVKFPANALATIVLKPFEYTTTVVVRPGEQMFSVAVVDKVSERVGYATARITPGQRPAV